MTALRDAGLIVTSIQPVVAEMATSVSKSAAHHPSNLDALVICRKRGRATPWATTPELAASRAIAALRALRQAEISFTAGDVMSVVGGAVLSTLTISESQPGEVDLLELAEATAQRAVLSLLRVSDRLT
jgi:putative DNA methylase